MSTLERTAENEERDARLRDFTDRLGYDCDRESPEGPPCRICGYDRTFLDKRTTICAWCGKDSRA